MHHAGEADGSELGKLHTIFIFDIFYQFTVTILQTFPDVIFGIRPYIVLITVFPLMISLCDGSIVLIHQYSFDTGRTKLNTEDGFPACD